MAARPNRLNRCDFLYADRRRCLHRRETPDGPLCYYDNRKKRKDAEKDTSRAARCASRALFTRLADQPLDDTAQINRVLNQLFLCVAGDIISARRADSLVREARRSMRKARDAERAWHSPGASSRCKSLAASRRNSTAEREMP